MFKASKRAERRHHYRRLKTKRVTQNYWCFHDDAPSPSELGIATNTPKLCSCHMCGNPRRYYKELTLGEKRSDQSFDEWYH